MTGENPFRAALEWFGPNGERWIKGRTYDEEGNGCAIGGLAFTLRALRRFSLYDAARDLLNETAGELFPDRCTNYWGTSPAAQVNDHELTIFDDIRALFEKAAIRFEERI